MTNNEHAARLREMAQEQLDMAKTLTPMYSSGLIATCRADAAALLAGAEALENLEVAKAALLPFAEAYRGTMDEAHEALQVGGYLPVDQPEISITSWASEGIKWADLGRATAALARLEGK